MSSKGDRKDDKKKRKSTEESRGKKEQKKKSNPKKKTEKKRMEDSDDSSSSSEDNFIPPPPNRRTFSLYEPPNPARHGAAASASSSSVTPASRGTLDHFPNSLDELFGPPSGPRPAQEDRSSQHQTYTAPPPIGIGQRRIFNNVARTPSGNERSETASPGHPANAQQGRRASDIRTREGSSASPSPVLNARQQARPAHPPRGPGIVLVSRFPPGLGGLRPRDSERAPNVAVPRILHGRWVQEDVDACRRLYMPEPVTFTLRQSNNGVAMHHASDRVYNPNTLVIEGMLEASLSEDPNAPADRALQLQVWTSDASHESGVRVYATWMNAEPHFRNTDANCQHKYQPYVHCAACALPERLGEYTNSPHVPDFFQIFRMNKLNAKDYRVLHISTKPPMMCDTDVTHNQSLFLDHAVRLELGNKLIIPLQGQIGFVDVVDRGRLMMVNEKVTDLLVGPRDRTVIMTARNGSEIQFGGLFHELMVLATHRSTVKGVSTTCQSMVVVANQGCKVEGCVTTELLDLYLDGDAQVTPSVVQPNRFNLHNYNAEMRAWRDVNPRVGAGGRGFFQAFHPAHLPLGVLAEAFLAGDDEDEDDDAPFEFRGRPDDDMPPLEEEGPRPMRGMQFLPGLALGPPGAVLQAVMQRSINEYRSKPKDPIDPDTFRCAPRPASAESQPKPDKSRQESACAICLEYKANHLVIPCGHRCICSWCANDMKDRAAELERKCPICNGKMSNVQVVFDT